MQDTKAAQITYANNWTETASWVRRAGILISLILALILLTGVVSAQEPDADFTCTPTGFWTKTILCQDQSTGNPTGWAWFFGDDSFTQPWAQQTENAEWTARWYHSSVVLPNGNIILMGGLDRSGSKNDTWRSTDTGHSWTLINPSSGWIARSDHYSVALPNGNIILMGGAGFDGRMLNDTWQSIDGGASWMLMNPSSGWTAREGHQSVVLPDGSIILTGGGAGIGDIRNDTWRSVDNGATWTLMNPSSGWTARWNHHIVVIPDGSVILTGGQDSGGFVNDIWRSVDKGASWTRIPENAGWVPRMGHCSTVAPDGSILLFGGVVYSNDVWRSKDNGLSWDQIPSASWSARQLHTCGTMPDGSIILIGGDDGGFFTLNDTWRFDPVSSRSQNPTHTYSEPGTFNVTLRSYNSQGFSTKQKRVTVSLLPFAALIAIAGACGIMQLSRKHQQ